MKCELKFTRKTQTAWCACRGWRKQRKLIPWRDKPSSESVDQAIAIIREFNAHKKATQKRK